MIFEILDAVDLERYRSSNFEIIVLGSPMTSITMRMASSDRALTMRSLTWLQRLLNASSVGRDPSVSSSKTSERDLPEQADMIRARHRL